ncbi:ABC-type sugar transport system, permease component [Microbacterium testaceum StLB037]|uniref:ABC-type sugar transport system, permease component n=1 Tax=Microbacterium testaceum (strain StLB037) TaxID=979556 RepID=E8N9V7_MICTS|nr:carbohydrate ABC transporter permease [Microbacterium testaceum]BAJ74576.1 ABC-type sugar transport system, permease component [Microbacterium testaceum StLB037]
MSGGILTSAELRRPGTRRMLLLVHTCVLASLVVAGLGPLLWLFAASLGQTDDVLSDPLGVFGHMTQWQHYVEAFRGVDTARLLGNTLAMAAGSAVVTVVVAISAGYVIAILRPRWAPLLSGGILATIFLPAIVSFVPLYLTVIDLFGTGISLQNSFWGVWLPAGANAFAVLLVTGYLRSIPRELIEAAEIDGAGPLRILWSVVLPLARPILGVVALLAAIGAWKDYLWPSLVLTDPKLRPISVALPQLERTNDLTTFFAILVVSALIPIALFLVFQRPLLASAGLSAGMKD